MSGTISLLQEQLPSVASKHLAPTQCQALEAKAEEPCPPPPARITFRGMGGRGVLRLPFCPFCAAQVVFLANPSEGQRDSGVPSPLSQEVAPESPGSCAPRCWGYWPDQGLGL